MGLTDNLIGENLRYIKVERDFTKYGGGSTERVILNPGHLPPERVGTRQRAFMQRAEGIDGKSIQGIKGVP